MDSPHESVFNDKLNPSIAGSSFGIVRSVLKSVGSNGAAHAKTLDRHPLLVNSGKYESAGNAFGPAFGKHSVVLGTADGIGMPLDSQSAAVDALLVEDAGKLLHLRLAFGLQLITVEIKEEGIGDVDFDASRSLPDLDVQLGHIGDNLFVF